MWDDLGVTEDYRMIFDNIAKELEDNLRKEFFDFEISSLKRFSDNLIKLSKEINGREKSIMMLHQFDDTLSKDKISEKLLNDMIQCIKNIRIQSINIVNHFNKIREICSYNVLGGKFNLEKINKVYLYDRNYLIKMKFDLDFLKNTNLEQHFNFSRESDPFLLATSLNNEDENYSKKNVISINEDMIHSIRQCEFSIMQDIIYYQIQSNKISQRKSSNPNSKSPLSKINYPLAKDIKRMKNFTNFANVPNFSNTQKIRLGSPQSQVSNPRPGSSSFGLYKLNAKNDPNYNNLFLNNKNDKSTYDKRVQIETKNKEREMGKSQENFRTFQNITTEKTKLNTIKQKEENESKKFESNQSNQNNLNVYVQKKNEVKIIEKLDYKSKNKSQPKENFNNNNDRDNTDLIIVEKNNEKEISEIKEDEDLYNFNRDNEMEFGEKIINKSMNEEIKFDEIVEEENNYNNNDNNNNNINTHTHKSEVKQSINGNYEEDNLKSFHDSININNHSKGEKSLEVNNNHNYSKVITKTEEDNFNNKSVIQNISRKEDSIEIENSIHNKSIINPLKSSLDSLNEKILKKENSIEIHKNISNKQIIHIEDNNNDNLYNPILTKNSNKPNIKNEMSVVEEMEDNINYDFDMNEVEDKKENELVLKTEKSSHSTKPKEKPISPKQEKTLAKTEEKEHKTETVTEDTPIAISFFNGDINIFQKEYSEYLKTVGEECKISFKPVENLHSYIVGINPKIILAHSQNKLVGVCCISYDSSYDLTLRLQITHFTTTLYNKLSTVITLFKDFIFANCLCDEILIDIFYDFKNSAFEINTYIRDILKNNLLFKWSKLENKANNIRVQKMYLKSTKDKSEEEFKSTKEFKNLLNVDYLTVFKVEESIEKIENDMKYSLGEKKINVFPLIYSLLELTKEDFTIENESFKNFNRDHLEVK
jgi:hypothetical protein